MLRPLGKNVLVRLENTEEEILENGIIFLSNRSSALAYGKVISVGPDITIKDALKVDDIVMFGWDSGRSFDSLNNEYYLVHEDNLLCIKED